MKNAHNEMKTICPLDCPDSCGLLARVEDGRVTGLRGDPDHPYTAGVICRKMRRYPERLYSSERLLYPMVRSGAKGEGRFTRISWDEALQICAEKLDGVRRQWGGQAILPFSYAGNMGMLNRFGGHAFFNRIGASRLQETICSAAAGAGWARHLGTTPGCPPENAADAELIVAWGIDIRVSNLHFYRYVSQARKRGGKLLVIDPYRNETAQAADSYQRIRPGGDSALALGMMKYLVTAALLDRDFIAARSTGFIELENYLRRLGWDEVTARCGIDRQTIEALAERLAKTPRTFIRIGIGLSRNSSGSMSVRAICSLAACLGLFRGGPGRGVLLTSKGFHADTSVLTRPDFSDLAAQDAADTPDCGDKPDSSGSRTINMIHLGHALTALQPPVKALMVYNSNPLCVCPDAAMVRRGLERDDLFTVVHEQVMTPTARYADLLLPATTFLENEDVYGAYGHFHLGVMKPVVAPCGEAKSNFTFFNELARKMGLSEPFFAQSETERARLYLETVNGIEDGTTIDEVLGGKLIRSRYAAADGKVLDSYGPGFFAFTPKPKASESGVWLGAGMGDVASHACLLPRGEFGDPDLQARFPFQLITPPHSGMLNSTFGERFAGEPGEVLVHPDDLAEYAEENIVDGSLVVLENHRGSTVRRVRSSDATQPGLLVAPGLFWPESPASSGASVGCGNINALTSQKCTDLAEGATFHESLVRLVPFYSTR